MEVRVYDVEHYTDVIGVDLQQSCEKCLKALLAYDNRKILKSHNLPEIYTYVTDKIVLEEDEIDFLIIATKYYVADKYPSMERPLPSRDEISEMLHFSQELFSKICHILDIDPETLK